MKWIRKLNQFHLAFREFQVTRLPRFKFYTGMVSSLCTFREVSLNIPRDNAGVLLVTYDCPIDIKLAVNLIIWPEYVTYTRKKLYGFLGWGDYSTQAALHCPDRVSCFYPVHQFKKLVLLTSKGHLTSNSHIIKQLMRMLLWNVF